MKEVFSELEGGCEGSSVRACVREGFFVGESLFFFWLSGAFFDVACSHWRGVKHWFYATPEPNVYSFIIFETEGIF